MTRACKILEPAERNIFCAVTVERAQGAPGSRCVLSFPSIPFWPWDESVPPQEEQRKINNIRKVFVQHEDQKISIRSKMTCNKNNKLDQNYNLRSVMISQA
jgi:hypothetical protein